MTTSPCPSDEVIQRAITALESGDIDDGFRSHLEQCQHCQGRVDRLASDPAFNESLRRAFAETQPTSAQLMETITRLSNRAAAMGEVDNPYDDLEPWIDRSDEDSAERLDGYVILKCIGRGGMGVVFKAQDTKNDRVVALKTMLPGLAQDSHARDRFLREARAIAVVRHPNVVAMYNVSEVNGLPYLIMEHVEGDSLEDLTPAGSRLDPAEIARIGAAVAAGLAACHEQDVIHRDIKPSNVLIQQVDKTVKITDFGLAAVANTPTLTHNGYLSGTPNYVAPERLEIGSEADERSDLFSLGCLLYRMATGEEPFGGDSPLITLHRIATNNPPLVRDENPDIPIRLEQAIASLMAKRPQDRPASAMAARDLLLDVARTTPRPRAGKHRLIAGFVSLAAIIALTVYAASVSRTQTTPQNNDAPSIKPDTPVALDESSAVVQLVPDSTGMITVATAAQLEKAVEVVPHQGRIEIDTDETLVVQPLYIARKSITISAAQGREPTIQLQTPGDGSAPEYLLRLYYGTLNLDGVHLQDDWAPEAQLERVGGNPNVAAQYSLLSLIDADLHVTGCRFETQTTGSCVKMDPGNATDLIDTGLFAPRGTTINWHAIEGDGLVIDNCVVVGNIGLGANLEGGADIAWSDSVILAETAALDIQPIRGQLVAMVSGCIIQSNQALVVAPIDPPSLSQFKRTLAWHGSNNQIRSRGIHLTNDGYSPSWAQEVATWAMGDSGSNYPDQIFRLSHQDTAERLIGGQRTRSLLVEREDH